MLPVSRWLGAFVLAAVAAAQQPGSLVVQVQGESRAVDLASGAVGKATGEVPRQPPPLQRRMHGMDYASIPTQAVFSPDGTRVAHVLRTFGTAAANGEIVVTDAHGDHAVEVTNDGGENEDPLWSADGTRLLFASRPPNVRRRVCEFHFADGKTTVLDDYGLMLSPRPQLLPDGFLLGIHRRPHPRPTARPRYHFDLVLDPCVPGRAPEVVKAEVPLPVAMQASANGLVVWLMNEDLLLRIDRRSGRMTHQWRLHELGDPTWPVRFGQLAVHPDGDLAAVTFWGLGWQQGKEGGRDVVALVEVPGPKAPKDAVPVRRHVVVGNDPRLLGFTVQTAATTDTASKAKAEPR
jgi:hypothetical protein